MNFQLNEPQRMLGDSVARYLAREAAQGAFQPAQWAQLAELVTRDSMIGVTLARPPGVAATV